jgi:hypothetical protein
MDIQRRFAAENAAVAAQQRWHPNSATRNAAADHILRPRFKL